MITVLAVPGRIHVSGHANMAPRGADVVCAAVSALTLTLIRGLEEVAHMGLTACVGDGNICAEWREDNDIGRALVEAWLLGMQGIAGGYPGTIEFLR